MIKAALLGLIALLVLAMFGRLRVGGPKAARKGARKCPACGRYRIGPGPCLCGHGKPR